MRSVVIEQEDAPVFRMQMTAMQKYRSARG
jgi:hypothetical protein